MFLEMNVKAIFLLLGAIFRGDFNSWGDFDKVVLRCYRWAFNWDEYDEDRFIAFIGDCVFGFIGIVNEILGIFIFKYVRYIFGDFIYVTWFFLIL
jgi:hypothetical protein